MRYLIISITLLSVACVRQSETNAINNKSSLKTDTVIHQVSTKDQLTIVDTTLHFDSIEDLFKYRNFIKDTLAAIRHGKKISDFEKEKIDYDNSVLLWRLYYNYFETCDKNNRKNFNFLGLALIRTANPTELKRMWQLFNSFPERYRNSAVGKRFQALLNDSPHNINRSLSPIASSLYESEEGKRISLGDIIDHQHQYYIILFTASWCGPCRYYATYFKDTLQRLNGEKVKVISISIDKSNKEWLNYLRDEHYNWHNYRALDGWDSEIAKYFSLKGIPEYLLVSKEGNVLEEETGYKMKDILHRINTSNME